LRKVILTSLVLVFFDQALKIWVKTNMVLGDTRDTLFSWFKIHFIENNGAAFGLFGSSGDTTKIFLTTFRIVVVAWGIVYIYNLTKKHMPNGLLISLGLVIGGAIGNIIDSLFYGVIFSDSYSKTAEIFPSSGGYGSFFKGEVVDMFQLHFFTCDLPNWLAISLPFTEKTILNFLEGFDAKFTFFAPIFNIADAGISVGLFLLILFYRKRFN
jgi:signal peptidase II